MARNLLDEVAAGKIRARVLGNVELPATVVDSKNQMRFGLDADWLNPSRKVVRLQVNKDDPDTDRPGAKRAWVTDYQALPNPFTIKMGLYHWSGAAVKDEVGVFGIRDSARKYEGSLSINVKGGYFYLILDAQARLELWRAPATNWRNIELEGYIHPTDGYMRVRENGVLKADYKGPLGSGETDGVIRYGVYHWHEFGNEWDVAAPNRLTFVDGPFISP